MSAMPKVSFIIPTLNRERTLEACLKSIVDQDYPNTEIVIVDGGSQDSTLRIASKYATKIIQNNGPLGEARQVGVENSHGDILAIFDSDVILPSRNWLANAVKRIYEDYNIGIAWAVNKAPKKASIVARCYFAFWEKRFKKTGHEVLPGGNSLILRKALAEAGGFDCDLHFGEDLDLAFRIVRLGYKITTIDPIIHDTMSSLREFTRKQLWGASSLVNRRQNPSKGINLFQACMTWKAEKENHESLGFVLRGALFSHVIIGLQGMTNGISKDKDYSWLIFPVLLSIRIDVYGIFLIRNFWRRWMKKCARLLMIVLN